MVGGGPVPEGAYDQLLYHRMVAVHGIPAAAEIIIISVRRQHIVYVVVKALEGKAGTVFISLGRMVKDHVQEAFDAVVVEGPDQRFQLIALPVVFRFPSVAGVGSKEADRVIAPVIHHLFSVHHAAVLHLVKLKDRHQLHSGDPQLLQIWDLFHDPGKGAGAGNAGANMLCEPAHMHLIDHQILHGDLRKGLRAPVEVVLDHPGLIKHVFFLRHPPDALAGDCLCVNVQKDVLFIEKKALFLVIGAVQPVCIFKILDIQAEYNHGIYVADAVVLRKGDGRIGRVFCPVEQEKLTGNGSGGVDGEIDPAGDRHGPVELIESGPDLEAGDLVHGLHMDLAGGTV